MGLGLIKESIDKNKYYDAFVGSIIMILIISYFVIRNKKKQVSQMKEQDKFNQEVDITEENEIDISEYSKTIDTNESSTLTAHDNVRFGYSTYNDRYPKLNNLEEIFINELRKSDYNYTLERLASGAFNVFLWNRNFVGKVRLQHKNHYLMYMIDEYETERIDDDFDAILNGIKYWENYISNYLTDDEFDDLD